MKCRIEFKEFLRVQYWLSFKIIFHQIVFLKAPHQNESNHSWFVIGINIYLEISLLIINARTTCNWGINHLLFEANENKVIEEWFFSPIFYFCINIFRMISNPTKSIIVTVSIPSLKIIPYTIIYSLQCTIQCTILYYQRKFNTI